MTDKYFIQENPFRVPVPDNKIIDEHFGNASFKAGEFSLARMIAPPGWSEPYQKPEFDEITLVIRGKKQIEIEGDKIIIDAGKSILLKKGVRVRYSNPFDTECEYISLCIPAFSPEIVNRG